MKKILAILLIVTSFAVAGIAMAVSFSPDGDVSIAYTSTEFDKILTNSMGDTLVYPEMAPKGYLPLNDVVRLWRTDEYHKIFMAYGLTLNKVGVAGKLGTTPYITILPNNDVKFAEGNWAYTGNELVKIRSLYDGPVVVVTTVTTVVLDSDGDGVFDDKDLCPNTPIGARVDANGCWVILTDTLFAFDKSEVRDVYLPMIDEIATILYKNPNMTVVLEGNTDYVGTDEYNQGLSERRAEAVKHVLVYRNNISAERIATIGFGEKNPTATNSTSEGRTLNRRVEIKPVW